MEITDLQLVTVVGTALLLGAVVRAVLWARRWRGRSDGAQGQWACGPWARSEGEQPVADLAAPPAPPVAPEGGD